MDNDSFSHDQDLLDILRGLESKKAEYPDELLAARRKLFLEQVEKHAPLKQASDLPETDQDIAALFEGLKASKPEYPLRLLARRRLLYQKQLADAARGNLWQLFRSSLSNMLASWGTSQRATPVRWGRASALALGLAMFAVTALALYGGAVGSQRSFFSPGEVFTAQPVKYTSTSPSQGVIICRDGYEPPLCLARKFDNSDDLSYAGNGRARPAVAKDTYTGYGKIHQAAHLNDGLYGPGASWVSASPNSWIKIDLGTTIKINTIAFGRDRLGKLNDGDPGRFVIAVATSDDVYANGNSSNDEDEYVEVYDSEQAGFDGNITGAETIVALFEMKQARFIKITFENPRTAIDEVEAFATDPSVVMVEPTKTLPREEARPDPSTPLPVNTPLPTDTATAVPIDTLPPTGTLTPVLTDPPTAVETPTPIDTPVPTDPVVPTNPVIPTDPVVPTIPVPIDTPEPLPVVPSFPAPIDVPIPIERPGRPSIDDIR